MQPPVGSSPNASLPSPSSLLRGRCLFVRRSLKAQTGSPRELVEYLDHQYVVRRRHDHGPSDVIDFTPASFMEGLYSEEVVKAPHVVGVDIERYECIGLT